MAHVHLRQVLVHVTALPIFPGAHGTPMEGGQSSGGWGRPFHRVRAEVDLTCDLSLALM